MVRYNKAPSPPAIDRADPVSRQLANMTLGVDYSPGAKRTQDKGKGKQRASAAMGIGKKHKLEMSKKKKSQVREVPKHQWLRRHEWSYIFVGNLNSSVSEEMLKTVFEPYGEVYRIQIRASAGVPSAVPLPNVSSAADQQYASVEFRDITAARRALCANGQIIPGTKVKMTVSLSIDDLPETQKILEERIASKAPPRDIFGLGVSKTVGKVVGTVKRLTVERTAVVDLGVPPPETSEHPPVTTGPGRPLPGPSKDIEAPRTSELTRQKAWDVISFARTIM
ncbi:uncharacterized protein LAESUDRAFT_808443 [Laetiporus sulphureus 93-53]|uniref:RRM domain-containing protein n=1 Tax=Laetiporus sulphureus 93-53 TaxID=1314785 RepID=A0A165IDW7_9APHY|nr:uncharacterized protein LAESUDRAFT_808443 [Laetiporus sulphureus 93-53]KZT12943.1 hypothetical protein LAESUDRAFT_808443 [Laetiporus sulphureus 93-53]